MRINYIITAYNEPLLLNRTIEKLKHKNSYFYIHIDKRVSITPFLPLNNIQHVKLIEERIESKWGDISTIEAIYNCLIKANNDSKDEKSYYVIMSGQDYPLKSANYIHTFFEKNYLFYLKCNNKTKLDYNTKKKYLQ